tara:strand:- start:799 stop:951 length:153 start_codon:yes stop_codon:yes gene_type:complete
MELPINERELNTIINALRIGGDTALYEKLWTFNLNYFNNQNEKENENAIS